MIYAVVQPKYLGRRIQLVDTPNQALNLAARGDRIFKLLDNMKHQTADVICALIDHKVNRKEFLAV